MAEITEIRDVLILGGGLVGMTLAIGLAVPEAEFDGRCLDLDAGAGNTCARH